MQHTATPEPAQAQAQQLHTEAPLPEVVTPAPAVKAQGRRNTSGVPEWNEAEVNAVLDLWNQHNRLPQWKPIANKLAALNRNGELNSLLAAKGIERTNNAVMNKVKELSGMSRARRNRPRTLGNFATLDGAAAAAAAAPAPLGQPSPGGGVGAEVAAAPDPRALTDSLYSAIDMAGAFPPPLATPLATPQADAVAHDGLPGGAATPATGDFASIPVPPPVAPPSSGFDVGDARVASPFGGGAVPPPTLRWSSGWGLSPAAQAAVSRMPMPGRRTVVGLGARSIMASVGPLLHETPVIAQAKPPEVSYAAGTGPAVPIVGPLPPRPVPPVVQCDP